MEDTIASTFAEEFTETFLSSSTSSSGTSSSLLYSTSLGTFNLTRLEDSTWDPMMMNGTQDLQRDSREYIFDRLYVRVIFILLYSVVFCFCFFGNLMVILVVTLHWRMRNITKFCLANLAFADLCVGVFCVYQNLSTYLINSWVLGEFLCKMYQFINALSHTASILILVVICVERYLAILHPFRCKQMLTINRLRLVIVAVWLTSAVYCSPRLYYITTLRVFNMDGDIEIICTAKRILYDSKTFDMIHFFMLFLLPLLVISILYTRVGITLWQSSKNRMPWTTNDSSTGRASNLSRSSSGTVNEETPSNSRPPSIRVKSFRDRSTKCNNKDKRESGEFFAGAAGVAGGGGGGGSSSSETNEVGGGNKNEKQSRLNGFQKNRNSVKSNIPSSPSFAVTIENKCYMVGPNETKVVDIEPEPSPSSTTDEGISPQDGGTVRNSLPINHLTPNWGGVETDKYSPVSRGGSCISTLSRAPSVNASSWRREGSVYCGGGSGNNKSVRRSATKKLSKTKNLRGGKDALKSRQTVVRMLIVLVVTFAVCNFPFHLRKMFQYWWPNYDYGSVFSTLVTPLTHLIMYANCAINPIIYAFMSKTFRSSFKDLLCLRLRKPFQNVTYNHEPPTQLVSMNKSFRVHENPVNSAAKSDEMS